MYANVHRTPRMQDNVKRKVRLLSQFPRKPRKIESTSPIITRIDISLSENSIAVLIQIYNPILKHVLYNEELVKPRMKFLPRKEQPRAFRKFFERACRTEPEVGGYIQYIRYTR